MKNILSLMLCLSLGLMSSYALSHSKSVIATQSEITTINDEGYITQLQLGTERWRSRVKKKPNSSIFHVKLGLALYRLAAYKGDLAQVDSAINHINHAISLTSKQKHPRRLARLLLSRASMQTTLHRFEQAQDDVKKAEKLDADNPSAAQLSAELNWNLGEYNQAEQIIRESAKNRSSMKNLSRLAILEYQLGNYQKAESTFTNAQEYDDKIDPITSSWLDVQMGIADLKIRQYQQAENHFRQARKKMPTYVLALEHLAETLAKQNKIQEAIELYKKVISLSDNPEFKVALSRIYQQTNQPQEAKNLIGESQRQYEDLLVKFPEAIYQHAADFYLTQGDKQKALDLLHKNLKLRPNSDSYLALSKAQHASGDLLSAKKSLVSALNMPPTSLELCEMAKELAIPQATIRSFKPRCIDGLSP